MQDGMNVEYATTDELNSLRSFHKRGDLLQLCIFKAPGQPGLGARLEKAKNVMDTIAIWKRW